MIDHLDVLTQEKNITVHQRFDADIAVYANPVLIDILIGNLLGNAVRHNRKYGDIFLTISGNKLTISNTGEEIPLVSTRIFSRFHKHSRPEGNEDSTGLGLAIVKNICTLYHYEVQYKYHNGHVFSICFDALINQNPVSSRIAF